MPVAPSATTDMKSSRRAVWCGGAGWFTRQELLRSHQANECAAQIKVPDDSGIVFG